MPGARARGATRLDEGRGAAARDRGDHGGDRLLKLGGGRPARRHSLPPWLLRAHGCSGRTAAQDFRGGGGSVDLVFTSGKNMLSLRALPMALPGGSQGCRTFGYGGGGELAIADTAPHKRSGGCQKLVFGRDAPLWSEQPNRSRTVMAARRVSHPSEPRKRPQESPCRPQHPWTVQATRPRSYGMTASLHTSPQGPCNCARTEIKLKFWTVYVLYLPRFDLQVDLDVSYGRAVCVVQGAPIVLM